MMPDARFVNLESEFWAHIRTISQHVGYTQRIKAKKRRKTGKSATKKKESGPIKIPTLAEITAALEELGLTSSHIIGANAVPTELGRRIVDYYDYRAGVLNGFVRQRLMNKDQARKVYEKLRKKLCPECPLPLNKQKGEKKAPAYFTGIINMLIEANIEGFPCDYDPRELTTVTKDRAPFRTLARRIDGAFPGPVNPIAVWEIKEYYYTTTFGSRVADGVYESLLDGMELKELRAQSIQVSHYLMVDDYFTWWDCGRSYLCRIIDMLHMGYLDEVLFGTEVLERLPVIAKDWLATARKNGTER
jgi:hypothetical protein